MKKLINERALLARINRRLDSYQMKICKCRLDSPWHNELGNYYAVDATNAVIARDVSLEAWGRELGVLKDYEEVKQ